jgi:hypothetical protein
LQGFDEDWVVTDSTKRFATYTNLDPGKYVFRVKAANKDGIWNDNAATLEITIQPPFWKTWWFRLLAHCCRRCLCVYHAACAPAPSAAAAGASGRFAHGGSGAQEPAAAAAEA